MPKSPPDRPKHRTPRESTDYIEAGWRSSAISTQGDQRPARQRIEDALGHRGDIQVYIVTVRTGPECDPEVYWIDASSEQRACARAIKYAGGSRVARVVEANRFKMVEEADEHPE